MKLPRRSAFTLVEMLTVMAVIAILASLIVAVNGFAHRKASTARAEGEIHTMAAACESYKGDFGSYPRDDPPSGTDSFTDDLDPRKHGDPSNSKYRDASLFLYKAISGDAEPGVTASASVDRLAIPDGKPETKGYCEFIPNQLNKASSGDIRFIQDPFGNPYGYSTAGAKSEEDYREKVQKNPKETRPSTPEGFSPNFDLWTTAGNTGGGGKLKGPQLDLERKRWIKNW